MLPPTTTETVVTTQTLSPTVLSSFTTAKEMSMDCFDKLDWLLIKGYVVKITPVNLRPQILQLRLEKNHKLMAHFSGPSLSIVLDEAYTHIKAARAGK